MPEEDVVEWSTVRWSDGTVYEGLTCGKSCEGQGCLYLPDGARYEGEWEANKPSGYGVFIAKDGTVSRGQFQGGYFSGCGVKLKRLDDHQASSFQVLKGRFFVNDFVGPGVSGCSLEAAMEAAREADVAAALARSMQSPLGRGSYMSRKQGKAVAGEDRKVEDRGGGFKWKWPWEASKEEAAESSPGLSRPSGTRGDWDGARERTRPLNDSEREKVRGLVEGLMVSSTGARQEALKIKI
jgi:hypothetical protein